MRLLHILSILLFLLPKAASASPITEYEQQIFIETWANLAVEEMRLYGIPASITLAQAIVESGWGQGKIARDGNNFFCVKCFNGWAGPTVKAMDDEADSSCFRKYLSIEESFRDHSIFLREGQRYQPLFQNELTDYKAWAHGLKAAGYATKEDYAFQLIDLVEKYGLYLFDYAIPTNQIKLLNTDFEGMENPGSPVVTAPVFRSQMPENEPDVRVSTQNGGGMLQVPGYQLGKEPRPAMPSTEETDASASMKIPLILPRPEAKFKRR
ncbi:MAG: glucosaminidase domain-containing protein [Bacteroidetes bacterium]|nr:glucosaminidase domain-containing protein [Bacteroidota bacterium]